MSDGNASKDPIQASSQPDFTPKTDASVAELIISARQAIEQKRMKQCMALIKAILAKESGNKEALALRSWIRSYLDQDLAKLRLLIEEARTTSTRRLYARAEITLRAILDVDPEHEEANELLSRVRALQSEPQPSEGESRRLPEPLPLGGMTQQPKRPRRWIVPVVIFIIVLGIAGVLWLNMLNTRPIEDASDAQGLNGVREGEAPAASDVQPETGTLAMVVLPLVGVQMSVNDGPPGPVPESLELKPGSYQLRFSADGYLPETISQTVAAGERQTVAVVLKSATPAAARPSNVTKTPPRTPAAAPEQPTKQVSAPTPVQPAPVPEATTGTLTLNSPLPVQVYLKDQYMGSTPVTIKLPSGLQTLEFRYRDLRKMVSYTIRSNEAIATTIFFDVTVRINAEPWAEVFLESNPPKLLGQTPLSGVTLPAGSVLIFRNPSFPEKKYQVNGNESSIQIAFP